jgi:hypothetical protein
MFIQMMENLDNRFSLKDVISFLMMKLPQRSLISKNFIMTKKMMTHSMMTTRILKKRIKKMSKMIKRKNKKKTIRVGKAIIQVN